MLLSLHCIRARCVGTTMSKLSNVCVCVRCQNTMGLFAAAVVGCVGGAALLVGGLVPAVPAAAAWAFGIGKTGIAAGSFAAAAQAWAGNVAAGSVLAKLTSIAMAAPTP